MRRVLSNLALTGFFALGLAAAASSVQASPAAAGAATVGAVKAVDTAGNANLVEIRDHRRNHRDWRKHHSRNHHWRRDNRRRDNWRRHHRPRSGIYFEFGTGGYRYAPPYYARPRYVAPAPAYRPSSAHVRWCYDRYRSYRASDNSFQPYNGPRRACVSPYMR